MDRRIIVVPGIVFSWLDNGRPLDACDRFMKPSDDFRVLYDLFTVDNSGTRRTLARTALDSRAARFPVYDPAHIYAFDYSADRPSEVGRACGRNGNGQTYLGADTRLSLDDEAGVVGTSTRFGIQFSEWRRSCADCEFDIVAHSLGGAVVAYWAATQASNDDLADIRSLVTIDSPINGTQEWNEHYGNEFAEILDRSFRLSGDVGEDLGDDAFARRMRSAPKKVDMLCVSNIYDILIPPKMATNTSSDPPCDNRVSGFSDAVTENPYSLLLNPSTVQATKTITAWQAFFASPFRIDIPKTVADSLIVNVVGQAHGRVLGHPDVLLIVAHRLAEDPPKWTARHNRYRAELAEPVRSPTVAPGSDVTVVIQLRNAGSNAWTPEAGVVLQHVAGSSFGLAPIQPISVRVEPGAEMRLRLQVSAAPENAVESSVWRLAHGAEQFGPEIRFSVSTLPGFDEDPLTGVRLYVRQTLDDASDRIDIEGIVEREVRRQIDRLVSDLQDRALGLLERILHQSCEWLRRELSAC